MRVPMAIRVHAGEPGGGITRRRNPRDVYTELHVESLSQLAESCVMFEVTGTSARVCRAMRSV